jgi:dihydroneopterin triphosphate diphosphatase
MEKIGAGGMGQVFKARHRRSATGAHYYAVLHCPESDMWQFVAGGGEGDETPFLAAPREASEGGGISADHSAWLALDATASIPRTAFPSATWPETVYVVPEYCFAVELGGDLVLSAEHDRCEWLDYESAQARLTWDLNRVALWELHEQLNAKKR